MSYTINPNAKNDWVRNADNTMDLSIETDASSVYLDNGRTLEQELGEGSMVSNVATVDSSMSKVIDGTLDGAYESCVFKGKSLVNLSQFEKLFEATPSVLNTNSVIWYGNTSKLYVNLSMFKPNTKYIVKIGNGTPSRFKGIYISGLNMSNPNGYYTEHNSVFTTPSTIPTEANMYIKGVEGEVITKAEYSKCQISILEYQEGMENWDIPYFEGMCSVKMPLLRNVGKNLFDLTKIVSIGNATLVENSDKTFTFKPTGTGNSVIKFEVDLKKNKTYMFQGQGSTATQFRNSKNEIVCNIGGGTNKTITPSDDITQVQFHFGTNESTVPITLDLHSVMISESSTVTTYEPYKSNILRTSEEIVLREVGGVQDTYNPLTGEYVQRIGEVVLDGSTRYDGITIPSTLNNTVRYDINIQGIVQGAVMNDRLPNNVFANRLLDEEMILAYINQIQVRLAKTKLSNLDVPSFLEYLQQNPIKIQYQLAQPITTIVKPSTMTPFAYENGHIVLESGYEGQSLLPTLEYSTVINRTGQIQSIANTIQKQEKQITKLEQMLIQNIIDLGYNNTLLTLKNEMGEML